MFGYYLELAWHSLRHTPVFTALIVVAIGLGIGASMTMLTVLHVMTEDPLPMRSANLYRPFLNPLPLSFKLKPGDVGYSAIKALTWPDAKALLDAHSAVRQAAMAEGNLTVRSDKPGVKIESVRGIFTTREFFAMFGVPFVHGGAWSKRTDADAIPEVVLTQKLARHLFGTASAIGKIALLDKRAFEVVGVVGKWQPEPSFYSVYASFDDTDQLFLPLSTAIAMHLHPNSVRSFSLNHKHTLTGPFAAWLQFWVELDTPEEVAAYRRFLFNYSARQKALGRYQRAPSSAKLYGMMQWLKMEGLVPNDVLLQTWLAAGFLIVCMINVVALLLTKFKFRSCEISVRRALGASRGDIFRQFSAESTLIGVISGLLGIGIAELGLWVVRQRPNAYAHLAHMNASMLVATTIFAVVVTVLAALLPAWHACRVPPVLHLRTI